MIAGPTDHFADLKAQNHPWLSDSEVGSVVSGIRQIQSQIGI